METDPTTRSDDDTAAEDDAAEFREEVEQDPSTAKPEEKDDTDLDRLRGG